MIRRPRLERELMHRICGASSLRISATYSNREAQQALRPQFQLVLAKRRRIQADRTRCARPALCLQAELLRSNTSRSVTRTSTDGLTHRSGIIGVCAMLSARQPTKRGLL
jgi:hypothetical protein